MTDLNPSPGNELLPCPFCGHPAYLSEFDNSTGEYVVQIQCANDETCNVCVDVHTPDARWPETSSRK